MLIRCVSDLHIDVWDYHLSSFMDLTDEQMIDALIEKMVPIAKDDAETILIIAGDLMESICSPLRITMAAMFLKKVADRFKKVLYVLGNHEHYRFSLSWSQPFLEGYMTKNYSVTNLVIADHNTKVVEIDGYTFVMNTLWTDYGLTRPDAKKVEEKILEIMPDHTIISPPGVPFKFSTGDDVALPLKVLVDIHEKAIADFDKIFANNPKNVVIITHHLPTFNAVNPKYLLHPDTAMVNHAFASSLDWLIEKWQPLIWFFGHTHDQYHGKIGDTILFCDPLGYPREHLNRGATYSGGRLLSL